MGWVSRLRHRMQDLWALRDVSFEVTAGEVVGIVGRNGAGKSTLLKILSGVTPPTTGRAVLRGRVSSLLEVGTGFHPDLTCRENVYLNGSLLGMGRSEIRRKFDRIVDFAEVEEFVDTPIKHFSTGMQMRLAFAVAAHLDGEILIIDEALSVGDAAFQAKCAKVMADARSGGRTVLLVSHDVAVLRGLARRILLLENGRLLEDGPLDEVLGRYLAASGDAAEVDLRDWPNRDGAGGARIERLTMLGPTREPTNHTYMGGSLRLRFLVNFVERMWEPQFAVTIHGPEGEPLVDLRASHDGLEVGCIEGRHEVEVEVGELCLCPGRYPLTLWVGNRALLTADRTKLCASLVVEPGDPTGRGAPLYLRHSRFFVPSRWRVVAARTVSPAAPVAALSERAADMRACV